jgi:hypothetical protein
MAQQFAFTSNGEKACAEATSANASQAGPSETLYCEAEAAFADGVRTAWIYPVSGYRKKVRLVKKRPGDNVEIIVINR